MNIQRKKKMPDEEYQHMSMKEPCSVIWNKLKNNKILGLDCLVNMVPRKLIAAKRICSNLTFVRQTISNPRSTKSI